MLPKAPNIIYIYIFFFFLVNIAIPVAALSTHCKIDFFWEVMFEHHHLVALSWCPSFFSMAISGAGIGPTVGQVALCCISTRE